VIFCHGDMGFGMLSAAEMIIGPQKNVAVARINPGDGREKSDAALADAIKKVDAGQGILVLTDLLGGTPSNLTVLRISENLEMITGFNLPLLINVLMSRFEQLSPGELAKIAVNHGRTHIYAGADLLKSSEEI